MDFGVQHCTELEISRSRRVGDRQTALGRDAISFTQLKLRETDSRGNALVDRAIWDEGLITPAWFCASFQKSHVHTSAGYK